MTSVDDTLSYIGAADLVIAMAGYNTTMEILRLKKARHPIPAVVESAEQRTRARLFAARRWVEEIDPDYLTPREADPIRPDDLKPPARSPAPKNPA